MDDASLTKQAGIPSRPVALCELRLSKSLNMLFSDTVEKEKLLGLTPLEE